MPTKEMLRGCEFGQAPNRYAVELWQNDTTGPVLCPKYVWRYTRDGDRTEVWFDKLEDLVPRLFEWYGMFEPDEYVHLYALRGAE